MKIANDAEIKLQVKINDDSASKNLDILNNKSDITSNSLKKIGDVGKKAFKATAIAIGTVSTALGGLVMKSVQMAGDLEQQIGGSEAVFKDFAETIQKTGAEAYKTMGLSQNDFLATANKMGALMQGSGLSIEKSAELSTKAMQRAADVASIMGIDIEFAMESIAGAAKGNFTMMDNLGVAMNATTIEAYALSKGIKTSYAEMSNAQKVEMAMEMFLEKSAYAMGNYAKENETFAGSLQTLKASFSNFMSGSGNINDLIDSIVSFGDILIKSIGEMSPKIVDGVVALINNLVPQIPKILQSLLPSIINGAMSLIRGLLNAMPTILSTLIQIVPMLMNSITSIVTTLSSMLPQILQSLMTGMIFIMNSLSEALPKLIPQLVNAILQLIPVLLEKIPIFIQAGINLLIGLGNGLLDAIPIIVEMLPQIIESLINGLMGALPQLILLGPTLLVGLAKGLISAIPSLVSITPKIWQGLVDGIKKGVGSFADVGKDLILGLWRGIEDVTGWLIDKIKGFGKTILNGIKSIFGINSPSKEFAWIGKMNVIGLEEGMEDNIPDLNSTIDRTIKYGYDTTGLDFLQNGADNISSMFSNGMIFGASSSPIYITVNADMQMDKFGQVFVGGVKTFSNGAKNTYNFGGGIK